MGWLSKLLRRVAPAAADPVRTAIEKGECPDCGSRFNIGRAFGGELLLVKRI